jgi:uncharacterized protein YkwD
MTKLLLLLFLLQNNSRPEIRIPDLERLIYDGINSQRKASNLTPLEWDEAIAKVARVHSEDMAKRGYFKHQTPEGSTPMKRLEQSGYNSCRLVGENIYQNNLYSSVAVEKRRTTYDWNSMDKIADTTVKGWMESPGHREVILEKGYNRTGIGVAIGPGDKVYITQVFCGL